MNAPHILVVDDDEQIRNLFSRILCEVGYRVTTAPNGRTALLRVRKHHYDVMVMDLSMPDMDGLELLRQARADCPHLKILVVSGFMTGRMLDVASRLGADATLGKILAPRLLFPVVCKMLDSWSGGGDGVCNSI
jgi:CheY-like chemotaxis protein